MKIEDIKRAHLLLMFRKEKLETIKNIKNTVSAKLYFKGENEDDYFYFNNKQWMDKVKAILIAEYENLISADNKELKELGVEVDEISN